VDEFGADILIRCRDIPHNIKVKMTAADGSFLLSVSVLVTNWCERTHSASTRKISSKSIEARLTHCSLSIFSKSAVFK